MGKVKFEWQKDEWERLCVAYVSGYDKLGLKELKQRLLSGERPSKIVKIQGWGGWVEEMGKLLRQHDIRIVVWGDKEYPVNLDGVPSYPLVLFTKGMLEPGLDAKAAAVVGTRRPTQYGIYWAQVIGQKLIDYGWVVVSGLAFGIDGVVHQQVVKAGGRTIAVIPVGLDRIYPALHQKLAEKIIEQGGCVISEVGPGRNVKHKGVFPRRNRIIAGLSRFLVVVEGGKQSGTLTTANFMINIGREVWALPGRIDNEKAWAPNFLIKNGAWPIIGMDDLDEVLGRERREQISWRKGVRVDLSEDERLVLGWLEAEKSVDELVEESGWEVDRLLEVLSRLELKGLVKVLHSGGYIRI